MEILLPIALVVLVAAGWIVYRRRRPAPPVEQAAPRPISQEELIALVTALLAHELQLSPADLQIVSLEPSREGA